MLTIYRNRLPAQSGNVFVFRTCEYYPAPYHPARVHPVRYYLACFHPALVQGNIMTVLLIVVDSL